MRLEGPRMRGLLQKLDERIDVLFARCPARGEPDDGSVGIERLPEAERHLLRQFIHFCIVEHDELLIGR